MRTDKIVIILKKRHNILKDDSGKLHRIMNVGGTEIFIPSDSSLNIGANESFPYLEYFFENNGVIEPTLAYDSSVIVNYSERLLKLDRGDFWTLKRVGENTWSVITNV